MPDIRHRVGIAVPQETVHQALTTMDGLASWWTQTTEGDPDEGGKLRFFFGGPEAAAVMEVLAVGPSRVEWLVIEGPDEWVGTRLVFDLTSSEDETVLLFTHADWREPVAFMSHCSTKWGVFLIGLKDLLEGGESIAFPNDGKISSWG
jgi:uncharacterized protein YndB with AHSA1/START domain